MDGTDLLPAPRRLTVDDYDRMGEVGILGRDGRACLERHLRDA